MRMRTMHSLGHALTQFDCPITFVAPPGMEMPEEYKDDFTRMGLDYDFADHVGDVIGEADVILVEPTVQPDYTKSRDERSGELPTTPDNYKITLDLLKNKAKSDAILLHSLPRMDEVPADVDITTLVPLLAGSLQRCRHAYGVAGVSVGEDGIKQFSRGAVTAPLQEIEYAD